MRCPDRIANWRRDDVTHSKYTSADFVFLRSLFQNLIEKIFCPKHDFMIIFRLNGIRLTGIRLAGFRLTGIRPFGMTPTVYRSEHGMHQRLLN